MTEHKLDRYRTLLETSKNFMADRPVMREQNYGSLAGLLRLLANEVEEAMETVENGDAIIEDKHVAIEQELADIGLFLLTAFDILGSDPFEAMMEKHMRNMLKYPAYLFRDGSYDEQMSIAKRRWLETGGNHQFYNGHSKYMIDFDGRELRHANIGIWTSTNGHTKIGQLHSEIETQEVSQIQ